MNCSKYTQWLSAALDGQLTAQQRRELDAHLAICPDCAALFETLRANAQAMRELDCQFPENLHQRIMGSLPAQAAPVKKNNVVHWRRWGSLAACLVLVAAAALTIPFFGTRGGKSAAPEAQMPNAAEAVNETPTGRGDPGQSSPHWSKSDNLEISSSQPEEPKPVSPPAAGEVLKPDFSGSRTIRVAFGQTPAPSARVISSADSLAAYLKGFGTNHFDGDGNPVPIEKLAVLTDDYPAHYFADHCLIAVVIEAGSGSNRYEVADVTADTVVIRAIVPEVGTCDMAAWLILIEMDEMLDDGAILNLDYTF